MTIFLGSLGLLLGFMVCSPGSSTYVRGLPQGVNLRPGRTNPRGNLSYLIGQGTLGIGLMLLAFDVVLRLTGRPFLLPGLVFVLVPVGIGAAKSGNVHRGNRLLPNTEPAIGVGRRALEGRETCRNNRCTTARRGI